MKQFFQLKNLKYKTNINGSRKKRDNENLILLGNEKDKPQKGKRDRERKGKEKLGIKTSINESVKFRFCKSFNKTTF